jgi:hypothetical protein
LYESEALVPRPAKVDDAASALQLRRQVDGAVVDGHEQIPHVPVAAGSTSRHAIGLGCLDPLMVYLPSKEHR